MPSLELQHAKIGAFVCDNKCAGNNNLQKPTVICK